MVKKEPALVILAAGMGSRYGGLKQIDTVGDNGESIIDFTIYDAIEAGFKKVYLIIQEKHQEAFDQGLVNSIKDHIEVEYIFQALDAIPEGYSIPEGREKPWGTTHALLACKEQVTEPFIILNADDYYGKDAFRQMYAVLSNASNNNEFSLMSYQLENTLSDSGSVTRALCAVEDGYLKEINEVMQIQKNDGVIQFKNEQDKWEDLGNDQLASMNFWGFTPAIFPLLENLFIDFFKNDVPLNPLKSEALLPNDIGTLINTIDLKLRVFNSTDAWFGVTYADDKPKVVEKFKEMKASKLYPKDLWSK
ncbi:MAG: nucleotidyltransferase [Erysipelothrix sp.]|nr:nucleotidyltransferase [Erysipelothrix sp.]